MSNTITTTHPKPRRLKRNNEAFWYVYRNLPFRNATNSLRGSIHTVMPTDVGVLPEPYRKALERMFTDEPVYIIWSYNTPIGWRRMTGRKLRMPDISYSSTTTSHQAKVRGGWPQGRFRGEYVTLAAEMHLTDRDVFRKGRGRTPFGPQGWGWGVA